MNLLSRKSHIERNDSGISDFLTPLQLNDLNDDWVKNIWNSEFMDYLDLPPEYEDIIQHFDFTIYLQNLRKYFGSLLLDSIEDTSDDESISTESWKTLSNIVNHEKLMALLFYFINKGDSDILDERYRECAITSARLYFTMLAIPGSEAYKVFHCQMYVTCLKIFKFNEKLENEECIHDMNTVNRALCQSLNDIVLLLGKFSLKSNNVCLEETISCLVDLTNNFSMTAHQRIDKKTLTNISELAFKCIDILILSSETEPDKFVINTVFKFLLPKFTTTEKSTRKFLLTSQTSGFSYCGALLSKYGDSATEGYICLIQHLCCDSNGMERADNRSYRVKLIVGLMFSLPQQAYIDHLQWIVKLSRNAIAQWRSTALDVIGYIVSGEDRIINAETLDIQESNINSQSTGSGNTSQDEGDIEMQSLGSSQHNVGHKDLVKVVIERCQDVSSTVRSNALAILVNCTNPTKESEITKELIKNESSLLQIAEQKLKDEKVQVRRAALKMLENVLKCRESSVTKKNLQMIITLCRDASILVRTLAINVLSNLAIHWRSTTVAESWIDGPMNQLSDPESKIQELVLDVLKNILFTGLSKYSTSVGVGPDRFPWILLNAIVRKNMRRHLSRACLMLSKQASNSKILNRHLIEVLITHVRTENNLSCWVLLSCIARYIPVKDISFVIDYFNDRTPDPMFGDIRLLVLVQEVLCEWCPALSTQQSITLREQLIQGLQYGDIPSGATRGAVSLAMRLTRDQDFSWAVILMNEYQNKILSYSESDELEDIGGSTIIAMADLALAADKQPSPLLIDFLTSVVGSFDSVGEGCLSTATRAASVAALGKLSLRDKDVAVRVTRLCGRLLSSSTCPLSLRINAMCVLADMSIRFTSVVEPMLPGMYLCLASPDLTLRRMAVQLMTQLLVADFLKLKDAFYFHYFSLVCDADEKIRDIASYYISQCLIIKDKNILYNNFVKSVFYFNNYNDPLSYRKLIVSEDEQKSFSMQGEAKRSARNTIYELMLNHMTDLQRLNTQVRLCEEAISVGEEATSTGEVGIASTEVLRDSLNLLRKLSRFPQGKEQNDDLATRVASNIVAQKMKSNDIDKVVPLVMRLYRQLKLINSPLISNVIGYACDLLKEYKQKVEEVFDDDADLLDEIKKFQANPDNMFALPNLECDGARKERRLSKMKTPAKMSNKEDDSSFLNNIPSTSSATPRKRFSSSEQKHKAKRSLDLNQLSSAIDEGSDDD